MVNHPTMDLDLKCQCGWDLPHAVMPMRNVEGPCEDDIVPGAIVSLVCPKCARGHAFYTTRSAIDAPADVRRKLGIDDDYGLPPGRREG